MATWESTQTASKYIKRWYSLNIIRGRQKAVQKPPFWMGRLGAGKNRPEKNGQWGKTSFLAGAQNCLLTFTEELLEPGTLTKIPTGASIYKWVQIISVMPLDILRKKEVAPEGVPPASAFLLFCSRWAARLMGEERAFPSLPLFELGIPSPFHCSCFFVTTWIF